MRIANPIYDAVVKFLLEDIDIAKSFLSILINESIISLIIKPQEAIIQSYDGLNQGAYQNTRWEHKVYLFTFLASQFEV